MIDTASGWIDLATYTDTQLLAHLDSLRQRMAEADQHSRIVEVRTFELRIADATRALAIINRRATEAQDQQQAEERTAAATLRGIRNALLGWRDDVEESCLDWGPTITDRIDAILKLAPSDEHWDRIVTIADEAFGPGPVEPLDATLTRIERGISEQHRKLANLEIRREPDLREACLHGAHFAQDRAVITDSGCGSSIDWVDEGRIEEEAARYARSKAGL